MKNYTIWLNGGNCIGGTAEEWALKKLKENYKKAENGERSDNYVCYELKDTDGIVFINLFNVQAIAINKCTENKDIGFSPCDSAEETEIRCSSQLDKCLSKFAERLRNSFKSMKVGD